MKLVGKSALVILAAALPLGVVMADTKSETGKSPHAALMMEMFTAADADSDGTVTQKELHGYRLDLFKAADGNGDGALSVAELDAMIAKFRADRMRRMLVRMDTDGNGIVGADEFARHRGRWMHHLDENGDGAIEKADIERMAMASAKRHHMHGRNHDDPGHHGHHGRHGHH